MANLDPLAVYIHWPYCTRICPYCDFNVYKSRGDDDDLLQAILKDLEWWREQSGNRHITSIHFGGGTPSLLKAAEVEKLINDVDRLWGISDKTEIALEANPIDADATLWEDYRTTGINRLSLGVQSFQDKALKLLGRDHDGAQARSALEKALNIFPSVSTDLIFGWVNQTSEELNEDLGLLLNMGAAHISTYQLTIERGTAFEKAEKRGQMRAVNEHQSADLFTQIIEQLTCSDFDNYEVSNFARPTHQSQHNLAYWRGYDYVGVGPGAHGRITRNNAKFATVAAMMPSDYIEAVKQQGHGLKEKTKLSSEEWAEEYVFMGLRVAEGISLSHFEKLSGRPLSKKKITPLMDMGLLDLKGDRLTAKQKGRLVLNAITETLLV